MPSMVRHGTYRCSYAVQRGLVISFCGQPLYCNWPYYPTTRFRSPSSHMVSAQPFPDRPRPMPFKSAQMWSYSITFLWLWPVTDHEPHSWYMPTDNTAAGSGWWCSQMAGINSDHSTREMECKSVCLSVCVDGSLYLCLYVCVSVCRWVPDQVW